MNKIGFIGAYDKIDLIIYVAKILTVLGKKVMVIDSTINQKARYVVPVINPTVKYITEFEEIDIAVGFESFEEIKQYLSIADSGNLDYDFVLIDVDNEQSLKKYEVLNSQKNYFVTSFDAYSLKKGLEIFTDLKNTISLTKILYTKENYLNELIKTVKYEHNYRDDFQNFIRSSFETLSLSSSMMNTYLDCPRQFLYSYVLRLSSLNGVNDALNYGNVVHKTIENFSKKSKIQGFYQSVEEFIADFKLQFAKTPFSDRATRKNLAQKGEQNLRIFYNQLILTPINKIYSTEYNIETKVGTQIPINGKIDRIETLEDGTFLIKDFKTGSAKGSYEIKEGGTYERYLNQLRFYKYLCEKKFDKKVSAAQLVFVEQCDKNYTREMLEEDNEIIENKIKEVYANIENQNFEPSHNKKSCEYCDFKGMCELNLL